MANDWEEGLAPPQPSWEDGLAPAKASWEQGLVSHDIPVTQASLMEKPVQGPQAGIPLPVPVAAETPTPAPEQPSLWRQIKAGAPKFGSDVGDIASKALHTGNIEPIGLSTSVASSGIKNFLHPVVAAAQEKAYSAWNQGTRGGQLLSPEADYWNRNLGGLVLGEQALKEVNPEHQWRALKHIGDLVQAGRDKANKSLVGKVALKSFDPFNQFTADNAEAFSHNFGTGIADLPIYLFNPKLGAEEAIGVAAKAAATALEGGVAGLLTSIAKPGSNPEEWAAGGAIGGGVLGAGFAGVGKFLKRAPGATPSLEGEIRKPEILGVVHPDHVDELAEKLAAKPEGKVEQVMVHVVDETPTGESVLKKVGPDAAGNIVHEQVPLDEGWTSMLRRAPEDVVVTPAAQGKWTQERVNTITERFDTESQLAAARLRQTIDSEKYIIGPGDQIRDRSGKVLLDADGAVSLRSVDDPEVRKLILRQQSLAEIVTPEGRLIGHPVSSNAEGQLLVLPMEGHPRSIAQPMLVNPAEITKVGIGQGTSAKGYPRFTEKEAEKIAQEAFDAQPTTLEPVTAVSPAGAGEGGKLPPEPPAPPAQPPNGLPPGGAPPPPPPGGVKPVIGLALSMRQKLGADAFKKLKDAFVPAFAHSSEWMGQNVLAEQTAKNGGLNNEKFYFNHLMSELNIKDPVRGREAQSSFSDMMNGFKTMEKHLKEFPEFEIKQQQFIREVVTEAKTRSKELARHGVIEEPVDLHDLGNHAFRGFLKSMLPKGVWSRVVARDENLKAAFTRQLADSFSDLALEPAARKRLAEDLFDVIVGDPKYARPEELQKVVGNKNVKALKPRMDLRPSVDRLYEAYGNDPKMRELLAPVMAARLEKTADVKPALEALGKKLGGDTTQFARDVKDLAAMDELSYAFRQALGETDLGYFRLARTFAQQDALLSSLSVWERVTQEGTQSGIFNRAPLLPDGTPVPQNWIQLAKEPRQFGLAAGGWMEPEAYHQLVDLTANTQNATNMFQRMMSKMRWGMTVGAGHVGALSNMMYNIIPAMLAGGFNPLTRSPKGVYDAFSDSFRVWDAFRKTPLDFQNPAVRMWKRGQEHGLVQSGFGRSALHIEENTFQNMVMKELQANGSLSPEDVFSLQLKRLETLGLKVNNAVAYVYDAIDPAMKMASWLGLMDKAGHDWKRGLIDKPKAIKFLGNQFREHYSNSELTDLIEAEGARRVALSFPMHDRLAPGVKAMSHVSGLLTDQFIASQAEDARMIAMLPGRWMSNEPYFKANLISTALAGLGIYAGIQTLQRGNGASPDEVQQAFNRLPAIQQASRPLAFTTGGRDSRGELKFYDLFSNMLFPAVLMKGDPQNSWMVNAALAPLLTLTGSSVLGTGVKEGLTQLGLGAEPPSIKVKAEQHNAAALADRLLQEGYGSAAVQRTYSWLKEGNMLGQHQSPLAPQYDSDVALQRFLTGGRVLSPLTQGQVRKIDDIKRYELIKSVKSIRGSKDVNAGGPFQLSRDLLFGKETTAEKKQRLRQEIRTKDAALRQKQGLR